MGNRILEVGELDRVCADSTEMGNPASDSVLLLPESVYTIIMTYSEGKEHVQTALRVLGTLARKMPSQ